ncbi:hypothetical protein GCM10010384_02060 [Streptomyces djakartensis]|uniref:Uncharacterized protein n=1 Tax=Streptomyces djakartensis TaxID=68193 RepID=A0ABQ2Z308_9ACTN|nr:hypothetical protein GCM10010384_02060 [Streptomyces djakartensis]
MSATGARPAARAAPPGGGDTNRPDSEARRVTGESPADVRPAARGSPPRSGFAGRPAGEASPSSGENPTGGRRT